MREGTANKPSRAKTLASAATSLARRYGRGISRSFSDRSEPGAATESAVSTGAARPGCEAQPTKFSEHDMAAMWIGHATVLLRVGGLTILTDPVFSRRIGPRVGKVVVGIERLRPLPFHPSLMPMVDVVLVSHAHFDHLDRPTLQRLVDPRTVVITSRGTRRLVPRGFRQVIELDCASRASVRGVTFSAIRPRHWGARALWDHHRGCNSYLIEGAGRRVLFGGDTALTQAFDRVGGADVAVFGIGAYEPWERAHATPEQVWTMAQAACAKRILPVHHSTFPMGDEARDEPLRRLLAAAGSDAKRVLACEPGEVWAE